MSKSKKLVGEAPVELTAEQIAALEAERIELTKMVLAKSQPAPVNVAPVVPKPVPVEPSPISAPESAHELAQLIEARRQTRDALRPMQDTLNGMSEAAQIVMVDGVADLKVKIAAKLAEITALDKQIADLQKAMAPSAGTVVADLDVESVPMVSESEQAAIQLWESSLKPRLSAGLPIAEAELAALRALDKEHGQHLDALVTYYDNPSKMPLHYDRAALKQHVIVPAWTTRQTLNHALHWLPRHIIEARELLARGWAPAQGAQEYRYQIEEVILALTRPEGLARTLADQIGTLTGHLKRLTTAAKLKKAAITSGQAEAPVLIYPQPITGPGKPAQSPDVAQAQGHWDPFSK